MKKIFFFIVFLLISGLLFCEEVKLKNGDIINSGGYGYGDYNYYILNSGNEITTIFGKLIVDYRLYVYKTGEIRICYPIKEKNEINTPLGRLKVGGLWFYKNQKIHKYIMENNCTVLIDTPTGKLNVCSVILYEDGNIESCYLAAMTDIQTPLGKFKSMTVGFYSSGKIKSCSSFEQSIIKIEFGKFNIGSLEFYENGQIKNCTVFENIKIDGVLYSYVGESAIILNWSESGKFINVTYHDYGGA